MSAIPIPNRRPRIIPRARGADLLACLLADRLHPEPVNEEQARGTARLLPHAFRRSLVHRAEALN